MPDTLVAGRAFTLVEVLTVIVIISLLLSVAVPSIHKIRQNILRTQSLATVRLLAGGCDLYYQDFKMYPPSAHGTMGTYEMYGQHLLVECLTGYLPEMADGADANGFGFRTAARGTVYGPYNGAENVRTRPRNATSSTPPYVFYDSFDNPLFYFCYYQSDNSFHVGDDSAVPNDAATGNVLDVGDASTAGDYVRKSHGGAFFVTTYAIMSAGPDKRFMSFVTDPTTDDVTSFLHE